MGTEDTPSSGESEGQNEVRESLLEEYFHKVRNGDDAGAIKVLALILSLTVGGRIALG